MVFFYGILVRLSNNHFSEDQKASSDQIHRFGWPITSISVLNLKDSNLLTVV